MKVGREEETLRELLVIEQRAVIDRDARIRRLEAAVQAMAAAIRPLRAQSEDRVWRPVQRALDTADDAILDRFTCAGLTRTGQRVGG